MLDTDKLEEGTFFHIQQSRIGWSQKIRDEDSCQYGFHRVNPGPEADLVVRLCNRQS